MDLLVVDSASKTPAEDVALRRGAEYIYEPVPGLSRGRNRGAGRADGDVVAFIDDDAIAEPTWLSALMREFDDPAVMAVAGRIEGTSLVTEAERIYAATVGELGPGRPWQMVDRSVPNWFEISNFGGIGDGGNMAFRREAFDVWAGFDERIGRGRPLPGGEEHLAFYQLVADGYRVVYTPNAVVRHPHPATMEQLRKQQFMARASAAGYMTLLLVEQRPHRRRVAKYALQALLGKDRPWRPPGAGGRRVLPRLIGGLALAIGPVLYVAARASRARPRRVVAEPAHTC